MSITCPSPATARARDRPASTRVFPDQADALIAETCQAVGQYRRRGLVDGQPGRCAESARCLRLRGGIFVT